MSKGERVDRTDEYAAMFAAIGSGPRLRILRLLLAAHPTGMVAGEINAEIGGSAPTLSHHLDKLRTEGLITVQREGAFLRYRANSGVLEDLLGFLYAECCTRSGVVSPADITPAHRGKSVKESK